jgi:ATP-dependent RNA helicase SUPV3L1/SUV3
MAYDTAKSRAVTAVLGPTNTGKTHLAIERMLDHETGMIGLPLRLLAREIYDKIVKRVGADKVALITGEEKIKPEGARYWVSTVEAMPREIDVDFLAIDEVQLAADPERGHVFTDRLLNARGQLETLVLGAGTMRDVIAELIPGANFIARPRLSKLTYSGQKKITRLPERSAIIAFSASEVYGLAELIRRQRGGAAVVLGALSPRTRNAQVALYQSGDVDYLVATDAVGMGLNLDVDHVAFSATRKFDGQNYRNLTPSEIGQIAGRAGRHANDGTFGVTGDVEPFDNDLVERLETHTFDKVKMLQWRSSDLSFASLDALRESLREAPKREGLMRARLAEDLIALETLSVDRDIAARASNPRNVALLWDACQIPDYRNVSPQSHAEMIAKIYRDLTGSDGVIDEEWFARQVAFSDKTDGDIDTLANRIAHIRTWTFVSNRPDWLKDPGHWQERTREIENNLSDALHTCLTQRFVDQRTSALMKGLRLKDELEADIGEDGAINVENHFVGRLAGFRFIPESRTGDVHGKATRHAAAQVLAKELGMRTRRVSAAKSDAFSLSQDGAILWRGEEIGRLTAGETLLRPWVSVTCDEHLQAPDREKVQTRLETFVTEAIGERLKPLVELEKAEDVSGLARGIAFRLCESLGFLRRETVAQDVKSLDQPARSQLRKYGVRFGAFNIFFPLLLKPAPTELLRVLWLLKHGQENGIDPANPPEPPRAGLTSAPADPAVPEAFYRVSGYQICGPRAVRIDILERLADQIRAALSYRAPQDGAPADGKRVPPGAVGDGTFAVSPEMMSILGCSAEELGEVLKALGFQSETRKKPKPAPAEAAGEAVSEPAAANAEPTAEDATPENAEAATDAAAAEAEAEAPATTEPQDETEAPVVEPSASPEQEAPPAAAPNEPVAAYAGDAPADVTPQETESADAAAAEAATDASDTPVAAEASDVTGTAAAEAKSEDGEEDSVITVWRPKRRHEMQGNREVRGGPRRRPNKGGQPRAAGEGGKPEERRQAGDRGPGGGKRDGARPNGEGRGGRPGGGGRKGDRGRKGGGQDRRGPNVISASPKSGKAKVDADSPFAALVALKASLEDSSKEK